VPDLITWRNSFRNLGEEYDVANRKKQALTKLLDEGRISQSTYDIFNGEIEETIAEIQRQEKALLDKMNVKNMELEDQIKTLEMMLANFEIQHVTGEVDEETYNRQIDLLSIGLENARHEVETVKDAISQLSNNARVEPQEEAAAQNNETTEETMPEIEIIENPSSNVEPTEPQPTVESAQPQEDTDSVEETQTAEAQT
jgi:hypothetical protein